MLQAQHHDNILELRLDRAPVNALDPTLVAALKDAIAKAPAEGARAIVLSGRAGLFSAGLDVPALLALDRSGMVAFWRDFIGLLAVIGRCPVPTVAAITGHSPAGGAVLSLYCDYRVMARGTYRIGLNEVQVGLAVPATIQFALRRLVGTHRAERLMVAGAMIESEEALRVGFVDELADVDYVVTRALEWCRLHLALPPESMAETRRMARADLHAELDAAEHGLVDAFIDRWYSAESQATLHALVAKLKAKG
jgi:enoyl-CoA hydratase/carnithine racemase